MIAIKKSTQTLVVIGPGGVGKTTLSASIAIGKSYEGLKVLVLTIDPSLRLTQTLGFKPDGQIQKIKLKSCKGELYASTLNHEEIFNQFLSVFNGTKNKNSKKNEFKKNKLFDKLTKELSSSQDFTTLYALLEQSEKNTYDLIIVDTPPAQHTWAFLKSPEKLSQLFTENHISIFSLFNTESNSITNRFFQSGTQQVLGVLEKLTGSDFISELKDFFSLIKNWQKPINRIVIDCQKLLVSQKTEFIMVTDFDINRVSSAAEISQKIYNEGYNLGHLILNRVPSWLEETSPYKNKQIELFRKLNLSTLNNFTAKVDQIHFNLNIYKSYNISHNVDYENLYKIYTDLIQIK